MAQFNKAIPIVMVALMLTGLCGYLLQTDHNIVETSRYDYKGNLNPSVQYSKIDDWTEYNPLNNVTGWTRQDGTTIPTTTTANQYVLNPTIIDYKWSDVTNYPTTADTPDTSGEWAVGYASPGFVSVTKLGVSEFMKDNYSVLLSESGAQYNNYTKGHFYIEYRAEDIWTHNIQWYYFDLGDKLIFDKPTGKVFRAELSNDGKTYVASNNIGYTITSATGNRPIPEPTPFSEVLKLNYTGNLVVYFGGQGNLTNPSTAGLSMRIAVPEVTPATYVDASKFVEIDQDYTAKWTNKETNGIIRVLTTASNKFEIGSFTAKCPDNLPYDYYLATLDFIHGSFTCQGVTSIASQEGKNNPQAYEVAEYHYNMITSGIAPSSASEINVINEPSIGTYPAWKFQISEDHKTLDTWYSQSATSDQIMSRDSSFSPTHTFYPTGGTLVYSADYSTVTFTTPSKTYSDIPVNSRGIAYIGYGENQTSQVYVDSTVVAVDPLGVLWGNPELYLSYYFPDQMTENTRVLFNGFVKEGNSMTINGQSFPIVDGTIIHYDEIQQKTLKLPIKGMAVDFVHKADKVNVSLIFTEYSNYTLDLGLLDTEKVTVPGTEKQIENGYVISANGTWYWQSAVYDIKISTEDKLGFDITSGIFALSWSAACLLMIGFIIVCTAVMYYIMRDEMEITEWLAIMISIVILLVLGAIF